MASRRMVNFESYHSPAQKLNLAYGFVNRVLKLSDDIFHFDNVSKIYDILSRNNYPHDVIKAQIDKSNEKSNSTIPSIKVQNVDTRYVSITYVKGMSEKIRNLFRLFLPNTSIAFKYHQTARNIYTPLKDTESKPNVVYEIPCKDCNEVYVGQTGRLLGVRLKEHKADCQTKPRGRPLLNVNRSRATSSARSTSPYKTALRGHAVLKKHTFDFDKCRVLNTEQNLKKRLLKEACYITIKENSCNSRSDCDNISHAYNGLLHSFYN